MHNTNGQGSAIISGFQIVLVVCLFVIVVVVVVEQLPSDSKMKQAKDLYDIVNHSFPGEVVLEDRLYLTLGERKRDLESRGYPVSVIVGDEVRTYEYNKKLFAFKFVGFVHSDLLN